jgi:hypothetical protein
MKYLYRNSWNYCLLPVLAIFLISAGCSRSNDELPTPVQEDGVVSADWLLYEEQEQGTGQYPVRILVSKHYLRFDDNYDASDFLLLDRHTHTLYSVSHEERGILVIEDKPGDTSLPSSIDLTEERSEDGDAPTIDGRSPVHVRFKANNELCYEVVLVPDLLNVVTEALAEYAEILGRRQLNSLETVPVTMQTRKVYRFGSGMIPDTCVRLWTMVKNKSSHTACLCCRMVTSNSRSTKKALINSSFRTNPGLDPGEDPESRCYGSMGYWIPAFAGMTKVELIRVSLGSLDLKKQGSHKNTKK